MVQLAVVVPRFDAGGGAERVALNLLRHLDRSRFAPHLITFDEGGTLKPLLPPGVPATHLGTFTPKPSFVPLVKTLWQLQPDVVFSTLWHATTLAYAARLAAGLDFRLVARVAFAPMPGGDVNQWMSDAEKSLRVTRFVYPRVDHVIAQTPAMRETLLATHRLSPSRVTVLPNPMDLDAVRRLAEEGENPLRGPGPHLVFVGRLAKVKDLPTLLAAFRLFHERKGGTLTIVGGGEEAAAVRALARPLGGAVHLAGAQANPYAYLRHADAFVMSSRYDSFPNALLEAHALGIPAVSTDCPHGPRAIILPGQTGLLTPVADAAALAQAMATVTAPDFPYDRAAALAVAARHDAAAVTRQFETLLSPPL